MKNLATLSKLLPSLCLIIAFACKSKAQAGLIVSAFFGLDNSMPFQANFLCQGAQGLDGMPVNFTYPIDASTLSATDFEVVDVLGNVLVPRCAVLAPANEDGENRSVLLIGELGNATTNPPAEVRVVSDLFTIKPMQGETACSEIINLNGTFTTNIISLHEGPSLFFAQKLTGNLNKCNVGSQTIQVAWNGGITPYISGDQEADLFQYYIGYSDSSGILVPCSPISIADINDNDNFHELCFSTHKEIIKISMMANTVEDPNQDPNLYSEVEVSFCDNSTSLEDNLFAKEYKVYPNPFTDEISIENLIGNENFIITDFLGQMIVKGICEPIIKIPVIPSGIYFISIHRNQNRQAFKLIKR